ncbi:MAG: universal stress protein [Phycisphaerae bacterium]|nr:universal stress protein [Phycisphaerae bacterium]
MITFRHILCPTDFSELSAHATHFAVSLADKYRADLDVLHVVDEAYQYWPAMGPEGLPVGPPVEEVVNNARTQLARWIEQYCANTPKAVTGEVVAGRPFLEIVRYARENSIDLIVLGTHGRSGLTHVLLGSVTERVVRKAHCPVLTVRHPDVKFEMP